MKIVPVILAGGIGGGIVDDENVVSSDLACLNEGITGIERGRDGASDCLFFVPHRIEDREAFEVRHGLRLRSSHARMRSTPPAAQLR